MTTTVTSAATTSEIFTHRGMGSRALRPGAGESPAGGGGGLTAGSLIHAHGLGAVTMSRVAADAGVGRATLYKYFPDVESILTAWHERQVHTHLAQLREVASHEDDAGDRLAAVLFAYASMTSHRPDSDMSALLHRGDHVGEARRELADFVRDLISQAAAAGVVRDDVSSEELAVFCLNAMSAANELTSEAAVRRLVGVALSGLRQQG